MLLKIFLSGWVILITAIILNMVANRLGIGTWHTFAGEAEKMGFVSTFLKTSFLSKLFMFFVYPALLGLAAVLFFRKF